MPALSRVVVSFSGTGVVGPSSCSHYTTGQLTSFQAAVKDLWGLIGQWMPPNVTITVPNTGETYDDATGSLTELWTAGTTQQQAGQSAATYAAGVGGRVVWMTNGLTNNRRVKGSTFVVPLGAASYAADGTIADSIRTAWQSAVDQFVTATANDLSIWTRPIEGAGGKSSGVTAGIVPDKVATLRSRRT